MLGHEQLKSYTGVKVEVKAAWSSLVEVCSFRMTNDTRQAVCGSEKINLKQGNVKLVPYLISERLVRRY